ncbi:MAG TPA: hypothetical protein VLA36_12450 [Longimicrobiales bacterium]|nr:hypothetical protein [Longimicrobiales bacterium]
MTLMRMEDVVGNIRRVMGALLVLASGATAAAAQEGATAQEAYFGAVAEFFQLPRSEVGILGDWRLDVDEIPVVLFVARRAGISTEALVALRQSGRPWTDLVVRYGLDASHFHVPLPDQAQAGVLAEAFRRYRSLPANRWSEVALSDADIVALVNVRVLAQTLGLTPEAVLREARGGAWHEIYGRLIRDPQARVPTEMDR